MSKVLFFSGQGQQVSDMLTVAAPPGYEVAVHSSRLSKEEKIELIREAEYLVLHPAEIDNDVLRAAGKLKLIQLLTAGYDKVDVKAAAELGIPVATNGGANAWSVAEHAVALLLALYKRLVQCDASVRAGTWRKPINGFNTYEVAGKTVGILGAGNIGRKVARRFKGFETEILYYDIGPAPDIEAELGARKVELDELLRQSDIISIHMPLFPETRGMINADKIGLMKENVVIINTSRAEIIEEKALLQGLQEKRILGAGLDVFHNEPIDPQNPLLALDNVVLSPHSAGHGYEGWGRRFRTAWDNIQAVAAGQEPQFVIRSAPK